MESKLLFPMLDQREISRCAQFLELLLGVIEAGYVGRVMLVVVETNGFFVVIRLKRVVVVGKWGKFVLHEAVSLEC